MAELKTNAEQNADKARELSGFGNFSLIGVRQEVATILGMIGQVKGIFSTYTKHDISHIDSLLQMLDWLIPPSTQEKMLPLEWLMIVLACYLHDLGMVVTGQEYEERGKNSLYKEFLDSLEETSAGRDYLARIAVMPEEDKSRFFYQEFVRKHHAARIREWVTGKHTYPWGDSVKGVADKIGELLKDLPDRFRTNLGDVCESHHKENLDNRNYFPLCQKYGNQKTIVNVQYAALILRTADLMHVTGDRTPSVMYHTLHISDPMGIDEWQKQMGTFSVSHKGREFDPKDPNSHVIVVSADFEQERPYFVMTEFIAYANEQLEQTKRWAEASQKEADGEVYSFPWWKIEEDIRVEGNEPVPMRFELDRGRLLNLLVGHTIYNDPTVAVRELIQNSIDAVRYQYYLLKEEAQKKENEMPPMGKVQVIWDKEGRELIVKDEGIGMSLDVIRHNLMRVGASFYNSPQFQAEHGDFIPISRFGIGVLTCFMVSDNIEIVTCYQGEGYRLKMSSVHANYLLKQLEPGHPDLENLEPHGTRVKLQIRPSVDLEGKNMLDIVRHWVVLPTCGVEYEEKGKEKIGFSTPKDALRFFYFGDDSSSEEKEGEDYEIEQFLHQEGNETYELAYAIRKSFTPEKNFQHRYNDEDNFPGVCIEGIRVANSPPGFISHGITMLLSVRNNKKFRTTVSRENLEQDEEYLRVGKICAELLFDHLKREVKRISQSQGLPLSQASTAGRWLYQSINQSQNNEKIGSYLNALYLKQPLIVVERIEKAGDKMKTDRYLISPEELQNMEYFYTIESRLINYLGIISRDLGRELSLNDFLSTLAPELRDSTISPILVDAFQFKEQILSSHTIEKVTFSKKHQQSILKWILFKDSNPIKFEFIEDIRIEEEILDNFGLYSDDFSKIVNRYSGQLIIAPVEGDLAKVELVKTKIITVIDSNSSVSKILKSLIEAGKKAFLNNKKEEHGLLGNIFFILAYSLSEGGVQFKTQWREMHQKANIILKEYGFPTDLSGNIEEVMGKNEVRFNASTYWLDWDK